MKVRNIANNQTEISLLDGTKILISYETPVAALRDGSYYRTKKQWSATTTKHINKWLDNTAGENVATPRDQEFFDELLVISEK
ncbi:MAG: hypothetical protein KAS93_06685 [Gammaproteobacteria bacterium]|nr:hypothetical protein [Gammaproteobacteria bacterium]